MNAIAALPVTTTEQLLAMPEDGIERELIRGELREKPMTRRNPRHSRTESIIAQLLRNWRDQQPEPRGEVFSGEAGFRIRRDPDTTVGIDVAYISAELAGSIPPRSTLIDGPPILAVEILSPSDRHEEISEKVREYIDAGVFLVWVVDPDFHTIVVHQPSQEPELFNLSHQLSAEPHLPGFRVPVRAIFVR